MPTFDASYDSVFRILPYCSASRLSFTPRSHLLTFLKISASQEHKRCGHLSCASTCPAPTGSAAELAKTRWSPLLVLKTQDCHSDSHLRETRTFIEVKKSHMYNLPNQNGERREKNQKGKSYPSLSIVSCAF